MATHHCRYCGHTFSVPDWLKSNLFCPRCRQAVETNTAAQDGVANAGQGPQVPNEPGRLWVTARGFDDMGSVLRQLGKGFECQEIRLDELSDVSGSLSRDVLFVNCAGECEVDAQEHAEVIRRFVERGGSLYASDWAGAVVERAFPSVLQFEQVAETGHVDCDVVDPGLRELVGGKLRVHFDMGGWWRVTGTRDGTRIYLASRQKRIRPIVVGFDHGDGQVIYTSFHNHAQVSEQEEKLLRFLVFRPILAQAAAGAAKLAQAQQCVPGMEKVAALNRGQRSDPYVFRAVGGERLMYILSWSGRGTLRLMVTDPAGKVVCENKASQPPLCYQIDAARAGQWACWVEAVDLEHDNFAYVLTFATRNPHAR